MASLSDHHEFRSHLEIKTSSNRSFGLVFSAVFALLGAASWYKSGAWWPVHGIVAAAFLLLAIIRPAALAGPNRLWTKLGLLLSRVVSPIVMGIIFFVIFMPIGIILRWRGKDLLRMKFDKAASTYWIVREPPGPAPDSMGEQF